MTTPRPGGSAVEELATEIGSQDPQQGLEAVAALRGLTERLEVLHVGNARRAGWSWQQIAVALGVTKQTVHRKHGRGLAGRVLNGRS